MNATHALPEKAPQRGGIVGPVLLIGAGLMFLLNNLGVLSWDVWGELLRLWPLLLIAVGLDLLIGRRSLLGSLLVVLLLFAAFAAAIWWAGGWVGPASGVALEGQALSQPLGEASRARVELGMGVGTLRLSAQPEPGALISGAVAQGPRDEIRRDFSIAGDTATFKLQSVQQRGWPFAFGPRREALVWDLRLNPQVPIDLDVSTGAGTATLDLSRLNLSGLNVNTGVGATTLILPRAGVLRASVNGGIGETTITIPAGVAARIAAQAGIGRVNVLGTFDRQDARYVSPGYASAPNRVELEIKGGIGSITVLQEQGR